MYKYKYVTIKSSLSGSLKEDYKDIISEYSERGYELVSVLPLYINKTVPSQYDFIFKKLAK